MIGWDEMEQRHGENGRYGPVIEDTEDFVMEYF